MRRSAGSLVALLAFASTQAWAVARPEHVHEDLFGEEDILVGFKLRPQLNSYTPIQVGDAVVNIQPTMRFLVGAAFKFIYSLPRFEFDIFLNGRGHLNRSDTLYSIATPVVGKIPYEIDKGIDLEGGFGVQPDMVLFGADPHQSFMIGLLGSLGISVDFQEYVFEFELRYNVGLNDIAPEVNGARHRDFEMIGGFMWHF